MADRIVGLGSRDTKVSAALDATLPRSYSPTLDPRTDAAIRRRWEELKPWVMLQGGENALYLTTTMARHHAQVVNLIRRGIKMRDIRRNALDDPLLPPDKLELLLQNHLARRTKRRHNARRRVPQCLQRKN